MRKNRTVLLLLSIALASPLAVSAFAEKDDEKEVKVKLLECPAAVQKSLQKEAGATDIGEVEKEVEDGITVYEAEVLIAGRKYSIEVDESGVLLEKELDEEEVEKEIKLSDCPAAVQKILQQEAGNGKIEEVDQVSEEGHVTYEADVMIDGRKYEVEVSDGGLLLSKKLDKEDDGEDDDSVKNDKDSEEDEEN